MWSVVAESNNHCELSEETLLAAMQMNTLDAGWHRSHGHGHGPCHARGLCLGRLARLLPDHPSA